MTLAGVDVPVVSIHDLLEMKRRVARSKDLADVEALEEILALRGEPS